MVEPRYWRNVEGVFHPDVDYRQIESMKEIYMSQYEIIKELFDHTYNDPISQIISSIKELPGDEEYPSGYKLDLLQKSESSAISTAKLLAFAFSQSDFCERSSN